VQGYKDHDLGRDSQYSVEEESSGDEEKGEELENKDHGGGTR